MKSRFKFRECAVVSVVVGVTFSSSPGTTTEAERGSPGVSSTRALATVAVTATPERKVSAQAPSNLKNRQSEKVQAERKNRLALQIPRALQPRIARRVELRIGRDLERVRALRGQAIKLLKAMLKGLPARAAEVPPTLLRLGELEWEQERESFLKKFAEWEKIPADERREPPTPNYAGARARFGRVLAEFVGFERYDLALYVDGFLATEEGETEVALQRFNRILSEFPTSSFVPDAHMVRAEAEFAKDEPRYEYALKEYEAVLAHPEAEVYDLALFKSAWALWRLGQSQEAARRFLSVFQKSARQKSRTNGALPQRALGELQAEALKSLVAVFVEDEKNSADDMYGFLVGAGGEKFASEIVGALAETLYEQAHYLRGVEAYRLLVRLEPTDPAAVAHQISIAEGHAALEDWSALRADYELLLRDYVSRVASGSSRATASSVWASAQDLATRRAADQSVEQHLYADAVGIHAKAQADKTSRSEFEAAAALYELYAGRFEAEPHAYEVFFNLGDIHFHRLHNEVKAADAYLAAVRLHPQGKWSRDALYNSLGALEGARESEFQRARQAKIAPVETPTDKKLTEAMELYGETYPDDPQLPAMLYRQGQLYYDYAVYDVAVRQWGLLLEKHPDHQTARSAGELILDSFNKSADYGNIETWGRRLLSAPAFAASDAQSRLKGLIVQSLFKQGEQKSAEGNHVASANAYLKAAREFSGDQRAASAAVNAAVEARLALDLGLLRSSASLLIESHRDAPEAAEGVWVAATAHQELGLLEEAAGLHEALAQHWKSSSHHRDASYNSVLLRSSLGQRDAAVSAGHGFHSKYAKGALADEVTFLLGKAHERAEDWQAAERLYARYSRVAKLSSRRIEALVRLAKARIELKNSKAAKTALSQAMKQRRKFRRSLDDRGKYYGAQAHFLHAQRLVADYEKVQISGSAKGLPKRLKTKAKRLKVASDALLATAKLGVAEWTTASLYQIGFVYESFASALLASPPPANLSAEQQDDFQMQIDEFVIPIEERSLEAYESGWFKAVDLGIYNSWTAKMRVALGRLNTEVYPPIDEVGLMVQAEGAHDFPDLIASPRRTKLGESLPYLVEAGP